MLVVDTSAFISLAVGDVLETVLDEFDIVTTQIIVDELEQTADYEDLHGRGATNALAYMDRVDIVDADGQDFVTSRIDSGEASCIVAVRAVDAAFLITDDYRALPELQRLVDADVALSPIVLRALIKRDALSEEEAKATLQTIAEQRDWLGAPIYRYARQLFD
ncbi:hypothetical protein [Halomicrococcus sp. NG-SE-24]|uniref:hypothetical protein n=1 Tax=Halomicrococcus sp. NG-SE-24 TaxID=3436928 RepID=UPI003D98B113